MITIIAATDRNGLIGDGDRLPWSCPPDLTRFKRLTLHNAVIMGRKTFESIGHPLSERLNIVLTSQKLTPSHNLLVTRSIIQAIILAKECGHPHPFVIGGASVYAQALPFAACLELTEIEGDYTGDVHFPTPDLWLPKFQLKTSYQFLGYKTLTYWRKHGSHPSSAI